MEHPDLQPRAHKSRSSVWQNDTSKLDEEKPKKQVKFNVDEELGNDPMYPLGLNLFLVESVATE